MATATTRRTPRGPIADRLRAAEDPPARRATGRGKRARNLVIVESPAKARTVENILGDDYRVIASVGHVRDLPPYGYGVEDIENLDFRPKYVVVKDKKRGVDKTGVIKEIADAAQQAERVFLSTDPDREGEAIAWHIREAAGIPEAKTKRVVFHEITKPAIEHAFEEALDPARALTNGGKAPGQLDMDLVDAQQARRVLDRLIGFPLTWFVQGKVSRSASAGRVQSVALRLIVDREKVIRDFRAQEYWSIHALLGRESTAFTADLAKLPGQGKKHLRPGTGPFDPAIPSQADADELIGRFNRSRFTVTSVKKGERKKSPVPPFTTSTFQQAANNRLGLGAQRAMGIAQSLYEGISVPGQGSVGLITYMRTDSLNISPLARGDARRYVAGRWGEEYVPTKERVYSTRTKGAQEAHEAIRPTDPARTPQSLARVLDRDQLRVYELIWNRFLASQMADARYSTVAVEIEAREAATLHGTFRAGSQKLVFPGHLAVYGADVNDGPADEEEDGETAIPEVTEGEALDRRNVEGRQHFTEPPPRYTEATLVKALEEQGIGRPSTYATIVGTVQKREYVRKEGRSLVPQELGFLVNDMLVEHLPKYVDVGFTSEMEQELDEVADGTRSYLGVVKDFWVEFDRAIVRAKGEAKKEQEETDIPCEVCGQANLVVKWGRNGKFFACPRYPECKNSMPMDAEGRPVHVAQPTETDYLCPKCGSATIQKSGPFGPYIDCVQRETKKCDFRSGLPVGVDCPECIDPPGQLVEKQSRTRKQGGVFYGCWNYPNCSYTTNSIAAGKMTPSRPPAERDVANAKLRERSARGKAAFASRKANAVARKAS